MLRTLLGLATPNQTRKLSKPSAELRRRRILLEVEALEDRFQPAPLFQNVLVSDVPANNTIADANTSRSVAVAPNGTILVAFSGDNGIRVARSTDRGAHFKPSVPITGTNASSSAV